MKNTYTILVNTCDKFDDCWLPFFKLFKKYWPDCKADIYLNTEYKEYEYKDLNIISTKVCAVKQDAHKITWSECLIRALDSIDSEVVLYMQEDYFLKDKVKNEIVEKYVHLMNEDKTIDCIHLTDQAVVSESTESKYKGLFPIMPNQRYFISCQAALWKKETLISYLRSYESAWQFEEFGSKRGRFLSNNFYSVDKREIQLDKSEIIPYLFTGIIQGRWYEKVVPLFQKHKIEIDYSNRGFVQEAPQRSLSIKLKSFYKRLPVLLKYKIEMLRNI